jgi:hypothetical protein
MGARDKLRFLSNPVSFFGQYWSRVGNAKNSHADASRTEAAARKQQAELPATPPF